MPYGFYCDNFPYCPNMVLSPGLCKDCKEKAKRARRFRWLWEGWTRYENNEQSKPGHKHGKDEK